jgi:hypothetical protein
MIREAWECCVMAVLGLIATLSAVFQARLKNETRLYTNWLREDYARQMGFKQFCFTDWLGRDKMRNVHAIHVRSNAPNNG